jgi:hypothetical protein
MVVDEQPQAGERIVHDRLSEQPLERPGQALAPASDAPPQAGQISQIERRGPAKSATTAHIGVVWPVFDPRIPNSLGPPRRGIGR